MADSLDLIKFELACEYEDTGRIDIAGWVRRHPGFRRELLDFWLGLIGTRELDASPTDDEPLPADSETYEQALRDACLAVTLGPGWLAPAVNPEIDSLAVELESLRRAPTVRDAKKLAFPKAVVYTWVVGCLQTSRTRVTRLATQKVCYVVEQSMGLGVFVEHNQKPLGPYDSKARYRDAEPIATKKGWLTVSGTTLTASAPTDEVTKFVGAYLRSESIASRLLERLCKFSDDQLETIATVHWVVRDLSAAGRDPDVDAILGQLATTPVWRSKLARANFSRPMIQDALSFLRSLRLTSGR